MARAGSQQPSSPLLCRCYGASVGWWLAPCRVCGARLSKATPTEDQTLETIAARLGSIARSCTSRDASVFRVSAGVGQKFVQPAMGVAKGFDKDRARVSAHRASASRCVARALDDLAPAIRRRRRPRKRQSLHAVAEDGEQICRERRSSISIGHKLLARQLRTLVARVRLPRGQIDLHWPQILVRNL